MVPDFTYKKQKPETKGQSRSFNESGEAVESPTADVYLPQVEPDHADAVVFVDLWVGRVLGVVDLRMDPLALVGGVIDLSGIPVALGQQTGTGKTFKAD